MANLLTDSVEPSVLLFYLVIHGENNQIINMRGNLTRNERRLPVGPIAVLKAWLILVGQEVSKTSRLSLEKIVTVEVVGKKRKREQATQRTLMAISIGAGKHKTPLKPLRGLTTPGQTYVELRDLGQIHKKNGLPAKTEQLPKQITSLVGGWAAIVGQNGVYLAEEPIICYEPVIIFTADKRFLKLSDGPQDILLGMGGHVVLACVGAVVILVGAAGFAEEVLQYSNVRVDATTGVVTRTPEALRVYKARIPGATTADMFMAQLGDRVVVYVLNAGRQTVVMKGQNPYIMAPIAAICGIPVFETGVVRIGGSLFTPEGVALGVFARHVRAIVNVNGEIVAAPPESQLNMSKVVKIEPRSASLLVYTHHNQSAVEIPAEPNSALYVQDPVMTVKPEARNQTDTIDQITVVNVKKVIVLDAGACHICFMTFDKGGAILLFGDNGVSEPRNMVLTSGER